MGATSETFKDAWISNLKAQSNIVSLLSDPKEIRETEWQGSDWTYPCIRVAVEFIPSSNYCGPDDANIEIEVYSEQKSSKQSVHIASMIQAHYHGHPFTQSPTRFNTVVVRKVEKPNRDVPAWVTRVHIFCQGITT
jgi:hypothetical protein